MSAAATFVEGPRRGFRPGCAVTYAVLIVLALSGSSRSRGRSRRR
jgi:hypothetical protein